MLPFNIFTFWTIERYSTASRNYSAKRRLSFHRLFDPSPSGLRPRTEKPRTAGFGVLFGANGSVIERSGTTDRVLHSATLKSLVPTNIDLGYKSNGLRWKGGAVVTQRQRRQVKRVYGGKWVQLAVELEARWRCAKMEKKNRERGEGREAASSCGRSCGIWEVVD
uniref:Transposon MuDR mudrA n=1 Tax=Solanum tuberosum TaxID=4113 RepID=M1DVQ9_SOLTU